MLLSLNYVVRHHRTMKDNYTGNEVKKVSRLQQTVGGVKIGVFWVIPCQQRRITKVVLPGSKDRLLLAGTCCANWATLSFRVLWSQAKAISPSDGRSKRNNAKTIIGFLIEVDQRRPRDIASASLGSATFRVDTISRNGVIAR
jgi:hypothetical protein